jgi:hypothetical protein
MYLETNNKPEKSKGYQVDGQMEVWIVFHMHDYLGARYFVQEVNKYD